ncbi:MAG: TIGR02391 family protein [Candidatus Hydrogenedentales bacterium]
MYTEMVKSPELRDVTERLYRDGHYASAVLEGFKFVNNLVKQRSGLAADGAALMRSTFSLNNPRLKLSDLKTQSKKDQQQGYMDIFAGCMTGVRNPRAHDHKYLDDPDVALKMLAWADHLVSLVNNAKRTRTHKFAKTKP